MFSDVGLSRPDLSVTGMSLLDEDFPFEVFRRIRKLISTFALFFASPPSDGSGFLSDRIRLPEDRIELVVFYTVVSPSYTLWPVETVQSPTDGPPDAVSNYSSSVGARDMSPSSRVDSELYVSIPSPRAP